MRSPSWPVVTLWLSVSCVPGSMHPTYFEDQLISVPGLEGIWYAGVDDEFVLSRFDSVTYLVSFLDGDYDSGPRTTSSLEARLARRNDVTFFDLVATEDHWRNALGLSWHQFSLHGFSVAEIGPDRITLRVLENDSLTAIVKRAPGAIAHVMSEDRVIFTAPTRETQAFLIAASSESKNVSTGSYRRLPATTACEELASEVISMGNTRLLRWFGVTLSPSDTSSVTVRAVVGVEGVTTLDDGLIAQRDTFSETGGAGRTSLSKATSLVVVQDRKNGRRLELRWLGRDEHGQFRFRAHNCHDSFPSSASARETLPVSRLSMRFEGNTGNRRTHYTWSATAGATMYEVLVSPDFGRPQRSDRFVVRDTSFTHPYWTPNKHTWTVRAYAPGIGFGPLAPIQRAP